MFAGAQRKADLRSSLEELCQSQQFHLEMEEWDILRSQEQDLSDEVKVGSLLERLRAGEFDAVFMSPPCNTWSRAVHSNKWGPRPLRNAQWPRGFPWLTGKFKDQAELGNLLVEVCIKICQEISELKHLFVLVVWEHPEDLGASFDEAGRPVFPASVWQLPEVQRLWNLPQWFTVAFFQCDFGIDRLKPTRLLSNVAQLASWGSLGPPTFDDSGFYLGPLPQTCVHGGHPPLIKQSQDEPFRTTGTSIYPPAMEHALAVALFTTFVSSSSCSGAGYSKETLEGNSDGAEKVSGNTESERERASGNTELEGISGNTEWKRVSGNTELEGISGNTEVGEEEEWVEISGNTENQRSTIDKEVRFQDVGVLRAVYKGKTRSIHDGLGLCSLGRKRAADRVQANSPLGSRLRGVFWQELNGWLDNLGKKAELRLVAEMLCGKLQASPFGDLPHRIGEAWSASLREAGIEADRRGGDRDTLINFRLLRGLVEAFGDPDCGYLEEMAEKGVRLGVEGEVERVAEVFEEKRRWNLPEVAPGEWEELLRDDYSSASEHMGQVRGQLEKDVEKGDLIRMSLADARRRYGARLKVASLAAVPKDAEWSEVRVVHDASNGVEVNHRIRLSSQMRFPLFDDLEAVLHQFIQEADARKLLMAYDYKGAHRLVPIHEDDWGLQACRLDDEEEVLYLNTVGTFGVASAAFWWARVAASMQRILWQILPANDPLYKLLYADDGLCLASGPRYKRVLLAVLLFLTVLGAPLSWRKTRGGQSVEWLGYWIDLRQGTLGIAERKVAWLRNWISKALEDQGVLGRDMKAALGRMGFLSGPLKHARPFLVIIYRWTAHLGQGAFVKIPLAVQLTMRYFLAAVEAQPVRPPKGLPRVGGEIFRVDAKADKGLVSIGGWESFGGTPPGKARWFSVVLDRSNAPWIFVKGEPFKLIAALELLAITVSVMAFGPGSSWQDLAGRSVLTAYTDNLVNSYVLGKFMSTSFPLSVVLMELALQLQLMQLEMELQWIPREQNEEADALTNLEFGSFDPNRRILVQLEKMDFRILPELMQLAAKVDEEIVLKKSSKEKEKPSKTDPSKKLRVSQPW